MCFIDDTLAPIPLPRIVKVKQNFSTQHLELAEIEAYLQEHISSLAGFQQIKPGQRIAITGGSRGINHIAAITRIICSLVKAKGAQPFVIPAMGSHGGATAEGQRHMLETIGITEETIGAPILSSMEVDQISSFDDGRPIYIDRNAHQADGIIVLNRIKAHTSFHGRYESGLMKMMTIGLGKQKGAQNYHQTGYKKFPHIIEAVGNGVINNAKIIFGVGLLENAFSKIRKIVCLEPHQIPQQEPALLVESYEYLARPFYRQLDVMVVKAIGKNISGTGCDSNICGRVNNEHYTGDIHPTRLGFLELTKETSGNANGMGLADFITKKLFSQADLEQSYPNALTSTAVLSAKIPIILASDQQVFKAAVKTSTLEDYTQARLSILENSKNMQTLYISENMVEEAQAKGAEILGEPFAIPFDANGNLQLVFN